MARPPKPKSLDTDEAVKAAVDELLGAFSAPDGVEPDDTGFGEAPKALKNGDEGPKTAPSADEDALWGARRKK
ncbi:MAG: hypothetical protein MUC96_24080 [Myxococcaceae bacterium]|jgi:hypothetical protein|nr:hypothetical protein [Myxococcaceae bacterium]